MRRPLATLTAVLALFAIAVPIASAQTPTDDTYSSSLPAQTPNGPTSTPTSNAPLPSTEPAANSPQQAVAGEQTAAKTSSSGSGASLPLTGLEISLIVAAGLGLMLTGVAIRRGARAV